MLIAHWIIYKQNAYPVSKWWWCVWFCTCLTQIIFKILLSLYNGNKMCTDYGIILVITGIIRELDTRYFGVPDQVHRIQDHSHHWEHSRHHTGHQTGSQLQKHKHHHHNGNVWVVAILATCKRKPGGSMDSSAMWNVNGNVTYYPRNYPSISRWTTGLHRLWWVDTILFNWCLQGWLLSKYHVKWSVKVYYIIINYIFL